MQVEMLLQIIIPVNVMITIFQFIQLKLHQDHLIKFLDKLLKII